MRREGDGPPFVELGHRIVYRLAFAGLAEEPIDAAKDLFRTLVRYLLGLALAARAQVREARIDPAAESLLRELGRRTLDDAERVRLMRRRASARRTWDCPRAEPWQSDSAGVPRARASIRGRRTASAGGGSTCRRGSSSTT